MAHEAVRCVCKNAVNLQVGREFGQTGVVVNNVVLPHSQPLDLQEIVFKNYYTAFLTVRVQLLNPTSGESQTHSKWVTCLRNYCLMPNPHTEEGSQEYFSFTRSQMLCSVDGVFAMQLILRQPSPVWLNFSIEELQLYPADQKGFPNANKVSSEVQQMWVLTEMLQTSKPATRIRRFEVDGCYDINLLSYT